MARSRGGSVVLDKRIKQWTFYFWDNGTRRSKKIGSVQQYKTKNAAWRAAQPLRIALESQTISPTLSSTTMTVNALIQSYRIEKMPKRYSSRRTYEAWLNNHIVPKWGECALSDLQARPVELWLDSLTLSPKSKAAVRGLLRLLWEFSMWAGYTPVQRNPVELVTVKGASKRMRKPRSLTVAEFQKLLTELHDPFHTIALVCVSFGLRISECLGLKWSDIDWLDSKLNIRRGIVRQRVGDTKTVNSERPLAIAGELVAVLKAWRQVTQFSGADDWVFASPVQLGRLPWSADSVNDAYRKAATAAGIGHVSNHSLRHTYRSWLDAVGTSVAVQQKLMRHADVRTTMNIYGDVVTDEMQQAGAKVAGLAVNGT
jgi:integrase